MGFEMMVPTRILFGSGKLETLHNYELPGKRALIVISQGRSTRDNGYLDRVMRQLDAVGATYEVFDKIQPNPLKTTVEEGGEYARDNHCDFIVALGGGSVMDASKAIAVMATNDGDLWDYAYGSTGKGLRYKNAALPIIAISTTAGTGSEVDQWGVITKPETNEKIGFGGYDELFPRIAVVDSDLMLTVPPHLTAYQGFDALFHSTECYISKMHSLMSDMYAATAIENVANFLPAAVADGNNAEARERVAFANTLSGVVMTVCSTTAEHSIEHAMSAFHHSLPHGAGLIMISKAFYQFFIDKHACDARFIKMAQLMGHPYASKPQDFIDRLDKLQRDCGVADLKMSDYGIEPSEFRAIAENARATMGGLYAANPSALSDQDVVDILVASYK